MQWLWQWNLKGRNSAFKANTLPAKNSKFSPPQLKDLEAAVLKKAPARKLRELLLGNSQQY